MKEARGYRRREKRERIPSRGTASKNTLCWDIECLVDKMAKRSASLDLRARRGVGCGIRRLERLGGAGRVLFLTV